MADPMPAMASPAVVNIDLNVIATRLQSSNQLLGQLISVLSSRSPNATGSFTMAAAATKTVTDPAVAADSFIVFVPTNAAAGTLMAGANSLYRSTITAGASFIVATAGGGSAAGTETFQYAIFNPL